MQCIPSIPIPAFFLPHLYNYQTHFGHDNILEQILNMLAKVRRLKLKPSSEIIF